MNCRRPFWAAAFACCKFVNFRIGSLRFQITLVGIVSYGSRCAPAPAVLISRSCRCRWGGTGRPLAVAAATNGSSNRNGSIGSNMWCTAATHQRQSCQSCHPLLQATFSVSSGVSLHQQRSRQRPVIFSTSSASSPSSAPVLMHFAFIDCRPWIRISASFTFEYLHLYLFSFVSEFAVRNCNCNCHYNCNCWLRSLSRWFVAFLNCFSCFDGSCIICALYWQSALSPHCQFDLDTTQRVFRECVDCLAIKWAIESHKRCQPNAPECIKVLGCFN